MSRARENPRRNDDTIAAVATPSGYGGIHVVRLSGSESRRIADAVFIGKNPLSAASSHTAHYGRIVDRSSGDLLDDVIAVVMWEPKSYTCEDTVEFSTHGSPYVSSRLLEMLIDEGARLAEPGEFTLRAFLNGRLDLSQAEAVADLIAARTESSHRVAAAQLSGNLSDSINRLKESLLTSLSLLEAYTDFPEEEIGSSHFQQVNTSIEAAGSEMDRLLRSFDTGRLLKEGLTVPIVGPPNSGKSSLFNYLLDRDRAIVTPEPGTTRDTISEFINLQGLPVELIDTAGLHESDDPIERAGIDRSTAAIEKADILVCLLDGTVSDLEETLKRIRERVGRERRILYAINKIDLLGGEKIGSLKARLPTQTLYISALTGDGIEGLKSALFSFVLPGGKLPEKDETRIASIRHKVALERARKQLSSVSEALNESRSHEFVAFDLKLVISSLGEIIGDITADDVLDRIFSSFCIGK